ncbi:MAG: choice-of-anchor D domain-containing protein, partial [Sphingobacteriales bacterium]|nr:choice-of-anchor D domain-containing protein [Sphingobacteriales bacterium]
MNLHTLFMFLCLSMISHFSNSANYYWIGGTGKWTELNHWATTSGGTTNHIQVPTEYDNVIFDANSFTANGQTVTLDVHGYCKNIDWSSVTFNVTFTGSKDLNVYGSLIFNSGMTYSVTGTVNFQSTSTGNIVTTAGKKLYSANFSGQNTTSGGWTLGSYLEVINTLYFYGGSFSSGGYNLKCGAFESYYNTSKSIDFTGTSLIEIGTSWRIYPNTVTTLNMGTANILISPSSYSYVYFYGGNKTYNDITLSSGNLLYYVYFYNNNTYRDITLNLKCYALYFYDAFTFRDLTITPQNDFSTILYGTSTNRNITVNTDYVSSIYFYNSATYNDITINYNYTSPSYNIPVIQFSNSCNINKLDINVNGTITPQLRLSNNNTIGTLDLTPGMYLIPGANSTQTIGTLLASGSCSRRISIKSSSSGTAAIISVNTGIVNGDYLNLKDINATGGATFIANHSLNLGNVNGWTISSPSATSYYWVGGSGKWNDPNHWSTTSGGSPGSCNVPTRFDNVYFDANSFSTNGQSVTIDAEAECNIMDWSGALFSPTFYQYQPLNVFGSFKLITNMNFGASSTICFENHGSSTNYIDLAGKTLSNQLEFNNLLANNATYILNSDLKTNKPVIFKKGNFVSNSYNIYAYSFESNTSYLKSLDFSGSTTIELSNRWDITISGSSIFNIGSANIKFTGYYGEFYGGNQTYNDISYVYGSASTGYFRLFNNNSIRDLIINTPSLLQADIIHNNTFRDISVNITFPSVTTSRPYINFSGTNTINSIVLTLNGPTEPYLQLSSTNTIGTLNVSGGYELKLGANLTQTINNLILTGSCTKYISISSTSAGISGKIFKSSGTVNADYLKIKDNIAQGGAVFNANHSIDQGNVSGWNIIANPSVNYYWVGGSGNWNDPNHWSLSSGGTANGCAIPSFQDNVFFDVNSFSSAGQSVTVNINAECKSMTWSGVTGNPYFQGNMQLKIYGSFILDPNMNYNFTGQIYFESTTTGNAISTYNFLLPYVYFNGSGLNTGEWDMLTNLKANYIYFYRGKLNSNGYDLNCYMFDAAYSNPINLNFSGNGNIYCSYQWKISTSSSTSLNLDQYTIIMNNGGTQYFYGGGKTYNNIVINNSATGTNSINFYDNNTIKDLNVTLAGSQYFYLNGNNTFNDIQFAFNNVTSGNPNVVITASNTFNDVSFTSTGNYGPYIYIYQNNNYNSLSFSGVGTRVYLGAGKTQTVGNFLALGSGSYPVFLQSTNTGTQAIISQASGQVCLDFIWLKDIMATGGASFNAGVSSTDFGNNTGWSFTSCIAYYWVGGSGNWSDLNHWATSSGGSFHHVTLPTANDNVFFDGNSFTASGQTVNINIPSVSCKNMSWLSSLYTPTLSGSSSEINVYGSLYLISGMNVSYTGDFMMRSNNSGEEINTAGKTISNIYFKGTGSWTLKNVLNVSNSINFENGNLNTAGKDINAKNFNVLTSNPRQLNLGASKVNINSGQWNIANTSNLSFNKGTSEIILTGENSNCHFYGNGLNYNNVTFKTNSFLNSTLTGSNTFNVLYIGAGLNISANSTQTTSDLKIEGNCSRNVSIQSTTAGTPFVFYQTSGTVNARFVNLKDNIASGGATFTANLSTNNGNVTGWTFTSQPVLSYNVLTTMAKCPSLNNGTAKVQITGGTPPFTYKWSTTETSDSIGGLIPGNYYVVVTDSNGCKDTTAFVITHPPLVSFNVNPVDALCFGSSTGSASLNITAGTSPFTYNWSTGAVGSTLSNLPAGSYSVTVTDVNNCTASASFSINQPTQLNSSVSNTTNLCSYGNNGSFTVIASGGTTPYQYSSDNGVNYQLSNSFSGLSPGTYQVVVKDANGCTTTATPVTISLPSAALSLTATPTPASCFNACNGSVALTASGGTAPYNYVGSDFYHDFSGTTINTSLFNISNPYSVPMSQNNELIIGSGSNSSWQIFFYSVDKFNRQAGVYFEFKAKTTNSYQVIGWMKENPNTSNYYGYQELVHSFYISSGGYIYIYEYGNNRGSIGNYGQGYNTYKIELQPNGAKYYINGTLVYTSSYYNDSKLRVGLCKYTYYQTFYTDDWKVSGGSTPTSGLCQGNYTYTVIDSNGCTATASASITQPTQLIGGFTCPSVLCLDDTVNFTSSVSDGTAPYSYQWNFGNGQTSTQENPTYTYPAAGTFNVTLTITDANGCISTSNKSITINPKPIASITANGPLSFCAGSSVTLTASTGNSYLWSNTATTQSINVSSSGTYTVQVSNSYGCTSVSSGVTVTVYSLPLATVSSNSPVNAGSDINLNASGGIVYNWSGPNAFSSSLQNPTIVNSSQANSGTYTVIVSDSNGCTAQSFTQVIVNPPAQALHFDGQDDWVNVSYIPAINAIPVTLEAYVKPEYRTENTTFYPNNIISNDVPGYYGLGMGININQYGSQVTIEYKNGFRTFYDNSIQPNQWVHIAVVYNLGNVKTYINGVLKDQVSFSQAPLNGNTYMYIGKHNNDAGYGTRRFFKGAIDEVRVWNRALCAQEISAHYSCDLSGNGNGLVANWNFDQGFHNANNTSVTSLIDATGNSNASLFSFSLNGATSNWVAPGGTSGNCTPYLISDINVKGNGQTIYDGTSTTSLADHTNFGNSYPNVPVIRFFVIENTGTAILNVSNISVSGVNSSNFSIGGISFPLAIAPGASDTFFITFNAASIGIYNATVNVLSDDCDEGNYDYSVRAEISCSIPSFTNCPANINANTSSSSCNAIVNYSVSVNGVPTPSMSYTLSGATNGSGTGTGSGTIFNSGITYVSITASNSCGTDTCMFFVKVADSTPPVVLTQNITIQLDSSGYASISASQVNNGSSDACGIASMTVSP